MTKAIKHRSAASARKGRGSGRRRKKAAVVTMAAWRGVRLARKLGRVKRRYRRALRQRKGSGLRSVSAGSIAIGSFALGASAFGAFAVGAVAIRRLAIKRAAVGRLDLRDVKVGRLEVDELILHSERRSVDVALIDGS